MACPRRRRHGEEEVVGLPCLALSVQESSLPFLMDGVDGGTKERRQ